MGRIIMTIEEKAKEYVSYDKTGPQDIAVTIMMSAEYDAFKAGAYYIIDKAIEWFRIQNWFNDYIIKFKDAMEE